MPPRAKSKSNSGPPTRSGSIENTTPTAGDDEGPKWKTGMDRHVRGNDSLGTRMTSKGVGSGDEERKETALSTRLEQSEAREAELQRALEETQGDCDLLQEKYQEAQHSAQRTETQLDELGKDILDAVKKVGGAEAAAEDEAPQLDRSPSEPADTPGVAAIKRAALILMKFTKETNSPSRKAALQQSMQAEIATLKEEMNDERERYSLKMDERERQIAKLSTLVGELQKQNRDVIGTSSEGVREARVENQKLREEVESLKQERDMLDLWNTENMRILSRQEEQLAKEKTTQQLLREQETRFQNESGRLVRSWNAKKMEYEHQGKNITRLEMQVEKLQEEVGAKDMLILSLRKASKARDVEQLQKQVKRLVIENQDKTGKIRDLETKLKKLSAQFDMSSQQKTDGLGLSLDAVAQLLTRAGVEPGAGVSQRASSSSSANVGSAAAVTSSSSRLAPALRPVSASVSEVQIQVMRQKLQDKDKEISALQATIKSYIAREIDAKNRLRDQSQTTKKFEAKVDEYRYEMNLSNNKWERKYNALLGEHDTLKGGGTTVLLGSSPLLRGAGASAALGASPDGKRTGTRGGIASRAYSNFSQSPDFDIGEFDLSEEPSPDAIDVSQEMEAAKRNAESILKSGDTSKPHWTSAITQGRPKSAFTGRTLPGSLIAGGAPVRPSTSAGRG
ncbi:unnamed protein product [Amoebophrya sp. A25]|nr:unnamed protein product [Amoebophrya sp. A25]|eukprot:GSA25T00015786001.1